MLAQSDFKTQLLFPASLGPVMLQYPAFPPRATGRRAFCQAHILSGGCQQSTAAETRRD